MSEPIILGYKITRCHLCNEFRLRLKGTLISDLIQHSIYFIFIVKTRSQKTIKYRRIPKVTAPVTFGFSSPWGPLLSGDRYRYFRMVKIR